MKNTRIPLRACLLSRGFSLAEVTIATGITAVAMTTLLGLIPQGLSQLREAGELSAQGRICRHVFGSLADAEWRGAAGGDAFSQNHDRRRFYFNDQAALIEKESPGELEVAYVAEVLAPDPNVSLPAASKSEPHLRRVTVRVAAVPDPAFDFDRAPRLAYRSQSTLIARTGL